MQTMTVDEYFEKCVDEIDAEEHPVLSRMKAKTPSKLRALVKDVAESLYEDQGSDEDGPPEPAEVIRQAEKRKREELEEMGVDVASLGGKATAKATEHPSRDAMDDAWQIAIKNHQLGR